MKETQLLMESKPASKVVQRVTHEQFYKNITPELKEDIEQLGKLQRELEELVLQKLREEKIK